MPRVMISYRNIDKQKQFALDLEKELANAGFETWLDGKDIPRLSKWEDEIVKGIINSDYIVLCLSPDYFESETCLFECYVARGYGKTILPIIIPYNRAAEVFDLIPQYEVTRGIDQVNILNFHTQSVLGLAENHTKLTQRLIKAISHPTLPNVDYDVYFSFRKAQVIFATRIADELSEAGIKVFIQTRSLDPGAEWRRVSLNAAIRSKIHIVFLAPDVRQSEYITNEVLITRTKKDIQYIPILAKEFVNDESAKSAIRQTFATSKYLSELNEIQWVIPNANYQVFIGELISDIKVMLSRKIQ